MKPILSLILLLSSAVAAANPEYLCFCERRGFSMKLTVFSTHVFEAQLSLPDNVSYQVTFYRLENNHFTASYRSTLDCRDVDLLVPDELFTGSRTVKVLKDGRYKYTCTRTKN